jgi:hypothetical protein
MGWMSKLHLRLEDGQPLVAQLPNEEIVGVEAGQRLYANLRNPKVFAADRADEESVTVPGAVVAAAEPEPETPAQAQV